MTVEATSPSTRTAVTPSDRPTPRWPGVFGLVQRFATDANSVLERQLCTAAVFFLSQLLLLIPGISVTHAAEVVLANAVVLAATAGAFVLRAPHAPPRAAMIIPLAGIFAVGLLRAGTGGQGSIFTIMMALPVISLGVEPGRLPMLLGGPVTVVSLLLPVIEDPAALENGQWSRVVFVPIILGLICLSVHELTRRLRSRVRAVQHLQREQERLLAAAEDNATVAAAASALLRESSAQLSGVINAVTEQSIIGTDRAGRIDVFNAGAQKLLGVAAHDAIGGSVIRFHVFHELGPRDTLDPTDDGTPQLSPFDVLTAGVRYGTPRTGDWTYVTGDGVERRVRIAITARRDAGHDVEGFLFVATDVTHDREQMRTRDEFVNLISHELRTPLSSILGYLELIADDEDNPLSQDQHRYLETVERNAHRLLRLVSDLLFTAQVESGRFQMQEQVTDLRAILEAAVDTAVPVASARNVTVRLAVGDGPIEIWGDPVRLGQAVDNLVSNAVKFTPTGGRVAVTLSVSGHDDADGDDVPNRDGDPERVAKANGEAAGGTEPASGPRALISVSDTGIGIPADEIDQLFSRFFRASTATQHAVPGVGLGLTITRAIAAAHGGEIRVASTVGEGTTFTLDLPVLPEREAQPATAAALSG